MKVILSLISNTGTMDCSRREKEGKKRTFVLTFARKSLHFD